MSKEDNQSGPSRKRVNLKSPIETAPSSTQPAAGGATSSTFCKEYVRTKFALYLEIGESNMINESHLKRLANLRKELNYIKNTDWQYDPPFGQS